MLAGNLGHAHAHLLIRHKVVTEEHEEGLAVDLVGSTVDGMAESARIVLVDKGDRQSGGLVHEICRLTLAPLPQHGLKLLVDRKVLLDLRLLARVYDHDAIDACRLKRLLNNILEDGLVEHGQKLLGHAPRCGQKARAKTCCRDNCLHSVYVPFGSGQFGHKSPGTPYPRVRTDSLTFS